MATKTIILPISGGQPDPTTPCGISVGAIDKRLFDAALDEGIYWQFNMPADYVGSPVFKLTFAMASATSGNVVSSVAVKAVTPGTEDVDAAAYGTANTSTDAVPGTGGHTKQVSVTLTNNDSLAANDFVQVKYVRPGFSDANDTAAGDLELLDAKLEYSDA